VLRPGRRSYRGRLRNVDPVGVQLEVESDEFNESCRLEVAAACIEAFEIFGA
jgi:hypothetical protein